MPPVLTYSVCAMRAYSAAISAAGLCPNSRRVALLALMSGQPRPATPEDVFAAQAAGLPRSVSFHYRGLGELHRAGLLKRIVLGGGGKVAYALAGRELGCVVVCARCRASAVVELPGLQAQLRERVAARGFSLAPSPYYLPGVCDRCRELVAPQAGSAIKRRRGLSRGDAR